MLGAFSADTLADLPRDCDWLLTLQCVLEGALVVEDRRVVQDVVALLAPYEGRSVVNAGAVMFHGVTDDTLSRGHGLLGDTEAAARLRASALATYERIGATWWRDRLLAASHGPRFPHRCRPQAGALPRAGGWALAGRDGRSSRQPSGAPGAELSAHAGLAPGHRHLRPGPGGRPDRAGDRGRAGSRRAARRPGTPRVPGAARRLEQEIGQAEDWSDSGRLEQLSLEREALLSELGAAAGLGGRVRRSGSSHEKARVAVRKAIVFAVARVAEVDPWLGRHLRDRVHTGLACRYESDPDVELGWLLDE